jgi:hypothetical protein
VITLLCGAYLTAENMITHLRKLNVLGTIGSSVAGAKWWCSVMKGKVTIVIMESKGKATIRVV